ncbi:hypothetical protein F5B19DRAFT_425446 [Rostrohypoxylon terebratum]|nr:hypothetical protein F5B19DRAFT_425446 [Rostrohypoxylon terebratum]
MASEQLSTSPMARPFFPAFCTASMPLSTIEEFLFKSHQYVYELSHKSMPTLVKDPLLSIMADATESHPRVVSSPPLQIRDYPFIGKSTEELARHCTQSQWFAILDERSERDKTVVIVEIDANNNTFHTVRTNFAATQFVLCSLYDGPIGIGELQDQAASQGGVHSLPIQFI